MKHAAKGGQIGCNGDFYEGGKFLPRSERPRGYRLRDEAIDREYRRRLDVISASHDSMIEGVATAFGLPIDQIPNAEAFKAWAAEKIAKEIAEVEAWRSRELASDRLIIRY
jgi:hypothetical protein